MDSRSIVQGQKPIVPRARQRGEGGHLSAFFLRDFSSALNGGLGLGLLDAATEFGSLDGVAHEHGNGQLANASGYGGNGSGHAGDAGITVSDEGASLFGKLLFA